MNQDLTFEEILTLEITKVFVTESLRTEGIAGLRSPITPFLFANPSDLAKKIIKGGKINLDQES